MEEVSEKVSVESSSSKGDKLAHLQWNMYRTTFKCLSALQEKKSFHIALRHFVPQMIDRGSNVDHFLLNLTSLIVYLQTVWSSLTVFISL